MQHKSLNWVAILVGWATKAIVGGLIVNVLTGVMMASGAKSGLSALSSLPPGTKPTPQQMQNMMAQMQQNLYSPTLLITSLVLGTLFLILGGFIAGKMAGHSEVKHGTIVGVISFVIAAVLSIPVLVLSSQVAGLGAPIMSTLMPIILSIPMAMLGGMLAEMTHKPQSLLPQTAPSAFDPIPRI